MAMMRKDLSKQLASEICEMLYNKYNIDIASSELIRSMTNTIDNSIGFIIDLVEEQAIEVNIK